MENEVLYDPLSFDNHIISEKLGMYDYIPANSSRDINVNLKMAMLQQELEKSRAIAEKNKAIAAHLHAKNKQQSKQQSKQQMLNHGKRHNINIRTFIQLDIIAHILMVLF